MTHLLTVDGLCYGVGNDASRRTILARASLSIAAGEWVAVTGPSGCGKSTLLHMIGGLLRPDSGSIILDGLEVTALSDRARAHLRRRQVGYVFQQYNLIDDLTVQHNVELPLLLAGAARAHARREAAELLGRLGLGGRATAWPAQLSGGEQQRVAIARALIARPAIVLADEPTGALDSAAAATVIDVLAAARDQGQTIVMVTHDPEVARRADRLVPMRDGTIDPSVRRLAAPQPAQLVGIRP